MSRIHRAGLAECRSCRAPPSSPYVYETSRYSSQGGRRQKQSLAIPMRRNISASLPPSWDISEPRYIKSFTRSTFSAAIPPSIGSDVVSRPAEFYSLSIWSHTGAASSCIYQQTGSSPATNVGSTFVRRATSSA